jgi:hypothetical protein
LSASAINSAQCPVKHDAKTLPLVGPPKQTFPQDPQLYLSLWTSAHVPPQHTEPFGPQLVPSGLLVYVHVPALQATLV